jgi:hypothetical protein
LGRLASRLGSVSVQVLLLPADPEANVVEISEAFSSWLESQRSLEHDAVTVQLPQLLCRRTAHAIALTDAYGEDTWNSYLAVHRFGVLEFGLGTSGGWEGRDRAGSDVRIIALTSVVARAWAVLSFAATLAERVSIQGPFLLTVAIPHAGGSLLGALGEGWAQPGDFQNSVGACREAALLWRFELAVLPESDEAKRLAYSIGDRLEECVGLPSAAIPRVSRAVRGSDRSPSGLDQLWRELS